MRLDTVFLSIGILMTSWSIYLSWTQQVSGSILFTIMGFGLATQFLSLLIPKRIEVFSGCYND